MPDTDVTARQTIGRRLKARRKSQDLTIEQIAVHCGVSANTVVRWESGEMLPTLERQGILAAALACSWSELFDPTPDEVGA